jgi:16S rRNA (guanine527-N7)-methyltransferase
VEHNILEEWFNNRNIPVDKEKIDLLYRYAEMISKANEVYNLTSCSTINEIIEQLILKSIEPVLSIEVPRGTSFIDIGTGQGIPGIPIAIMHTNFSGALIDSNQRKIEFIRYTINTLGIKNIVINQGRVEEYARNSEFREQFDYLFVRAFGNIYLVLELGSPFVKTGGMLYIYSNPSEGNINQSILEQGTRVGLSMIGIDKTRFLPGTGGIIFNKIAGIDNKYPRHYPTIKREAMKRSV